MCLTGKPTACVDIEGLRDACAGTCEKQQQRSIATTAPSVLIWCRGETAATLYSLIGTCRLNGLDPHQYLRHVLERIATHPINRIDELLPWRVADQLRTAQSRAA